MNQELYYLFIYYLENKKCFKCSFRLQNKENYLIHLVTTHGISRDLIEDFIIQYNKEIKNGEKRNDNQIICKRCTMDKSASEIVFDENGICNFCYQAQRALKEIETEKPNLNKWIEKIKYDGRDNKYDCLLGLSGGTDSSTTLHYGVELGLRILTYSIDNGWQSEIAQENVMRMVETLKVPFFRQTINLKRFEELQGAFLKAGLINIEIPSDHIILASQYEIADRYGIKWILSGGNVVSESIMPESWGYQPRDLKHIKAVYRWATGKNLIGLPMCGLLKYNYYRHIKKIRIFYLLDYL